MRLPWLDALLILLIVVGGYYVWQSGSERGRLQAEHERLKALTGELVPVDPTKIYLRALETGDPLDFAWRVYLPPNYRLNVSHTRGGSSSSSNSEAVSAIFRVRLRKVDGRWLSYHRFAGGSGLSSLNPEVAEFLDNHPDQLLVEQFGKERTEEIDPASEFMLIMATMPQEPGASEKDSKGKPSREKEPVIYVKIGPPSRN